VWVSLGFLFSVFPSRLSCLTPRLTLGLAGVEDFDRTWSVDEKMINALVGKLIPSTAAAQWTPPPPSASASQAATALSTMNQVPASWTKNDDELLNGLLKTQPRRHALAWVCMIDACFCLSHHAPSFSNAPLVDRLGLSMFSPDDSSSPLCPSRDSASFFWACACVVVKSSSCAFSATRVPAVRRVRGVGACGDGAARQL
jgi:hypothetical protein